MACVDLDPLRLGVILDLGDLLLQVLELFLQRLALGFEGSEAMLQGVVDHPVEVGARVEAGFESGGVVADVPALFAHLIEDGVEVAHEEVAGEGDGRGARALNVEVTEHLAAAGAEVVGDGHGAGYPGIEGTVRRPGPGDR